MKDIHDRHKYIQEQLELKGMIRVQDLADKLGVTGATIRRDLRILESQHALRRGHGNAVPVKRKATDPPLNEKYKVRSVEKAKIAEAAVTLLQENDSFMVTSGSTIEAFVRKLNPYGEHFVVTPSIHLARLLLNKGGIEVFVPGGHVVKDSLSVRDHTSINTILGLRCNKLFFSCDGFDLQSGITSAYLEESQLNIAMVAACPIRILLADSSKYGKVGFGKTCDLKDISILVTDKGLSRKVREDIEILGVKVIIV